jgi:manganese transport system ATP-binding protein
VGQVSDPGAIRLDGLAVRYGDRDAVGPISLSVPGGTTLAIIGANGSGKSSLLRAIAGLVSPTAGSVDTGRASIALVLQVTDVDPSLPITVRETVRMARYAVRGPFGRLGARDHAAVDHAISRLEVADLADRQLHELSGGQRQRVLVAQGLAQEADIVLLDEPVTGLDLVSRELILDVVTEERAGGRTVLMSTHTLDDARRCDQVLLLATRLVACGPPDEVLVEEHLRAAFGGRLLRLTSGELLVDDPHHAH